MLLSGSSLCDVLRVVIILFGYFGFIVLLYVNPNIDKRYIQSLKYITRFGYSIVNLEQNKINKLSRNIRNLLAKLNKQTIMNNYNSYLQQAQP